LYSPGSINWGDKNDENLLDVIMYSACLNFEELIYFSYSFFALITLCSW